MRRPARALSAAALAAVAIPLGACTSTYSSSCDTDNTCTIKISGNEYHDAPRAWATENGIDSADRIRLVSATAGGEALIQAGGVESTCTQGGSFMIVDTTITCDVVGDDSVELTTTRP